VTFSEIQVIDTEKVSTSAAGVMEEPSQADTEIPVTATRGAATSVIGTVGESSQPEDSQVSMAAASGISTEGASMVEELFQARVS